jgi:hypothetical protein
VPIFSRRALKERTPGIPITDPLGRLVGVVTMLGHAWGRDQRTTAGTCGLSWTVQSRYLRGEVLSTQPLSIDWFFSDTEGVTGSNPVAPTTLLAG